MARYDELEAYKCVYDTLKDSYIQIKSVPREIRYTLLESLRNDLLEVLQDITLANSMKDKVPYIESARRTLTRVKLRFRLLKDLHCLSDKQYEHFSERTVSASKQLTGWLRYADRQRLSVSSQPASGGPRSSGESL